MTDIAKRRQPPFFALAVVGLVAVAIAAWFLLVRSVDVKAEETYARAQALESELARAREFLATRPSDKVILDNITQATEQKRRRIPTGRQDLKVAEHFEKAAATLGISDFKYEVVGGMALEAAKVEEKKFPAEVLANNPNSLRSVDINLTFDGSYNQLVSLVRSAYDSPWHIEITGLELSRGPKPSLNMKGRLLTRYYYQ